MHKFTLFLICCFFNWEILTYKPYPNETGNYAESSLVSSFGDKALMGFVDMRGFYTSEYFEVNRSTGIIIGDDNLYFSFTVDVYDIYEDGYVYQSWKKTGLIKYKF